MDALDIKVVIGAGFGDEGKGRMVDYFVEQFNSLFTLVVRFNGGAQAGHTVERAGVRHIFSHFGAGSLQGVSTYLSEHFLVNPIIFKKEHELLRSKGLKPHLIVHPRALVSTPFDMLINQIVETYRAEGRHGSCGLGISETVVRSENANLRLRVTDLINLPKQELVARLTYIQEVYFKKRLHELGVDLNYPEIQYFLEVSQSATLLPEFLEEIDFFKSNVLVEGYEFIPNHFKNIVFEGAQGLLLDENCDEFQPHTTHSTTGIANVLDIVEKIPAKVNHMEVCYVSRAYLTRHGAGALPTEVNIHELYPNVGCKTNVHNNYQGSLRYGYFSLYLLQKYMFADIDKIKVEYPHSVSFAMTCVDQLDGKPLVYQTARFTDHCEPKIKENPVESLLIGMKSFHQDITRVYLSDSPSGRVKTHETVMEEETHYHEYAFK